MVNLRREISPENHFLSETEIWGGCPGCWPAQVFQAYPRFGCKRILLESIANIARKKPETAAFNMAADVEARFIPAFRAPTFCDLVLAAKLSA
jgi:hypothetical protein